ncbi:hypothetical protein [Micromonospora sp. WMMD736]|uniref:hypothetical protein n=1 Tax=Micromonospora sp. WMMD736 TaxID=3404112 RepID=UPI003B94CD3C
MEGAALRAASVGDERIVFTQRGYFPFGTTSLSMTGVLLTLTTRRLLFAPVRVWGFRSFGESWVRAKSMNLQDVTAVEPAAGARLTISSRFGDSVSFVVVLPTGVGPVWQALAAVPYRDETVRRIRAACGLGGPGSRAAESGDGGAST